MRVHVFDPGLDSLKGHHANYDRTLTRAFDALGLPTTIYAYATPSDPRAWANIRVEPFFFWSSYYRLLPTDSPHRLRDAGWVFYLQLARLDPAAFAPDDILLFHSLTAEQLGGIGRWIAEWPSERRPRFVFLFMFADYRDAEGAERGAYLEAYRGFLADLQPFAEHCRLFAEHSLMQADLQRFGAGRLPVAIAPHVKHVPASKARPLPPGGKLTIGYFGHAERADKGAHLLPDIVAEIGRRQDVDWLVQLSFGRSQAPLSGAWTPAAIGAALSSRADVTLIEGALSEEDYYGALDAADVVLLPYSPLYARQGSGVFYEALVLGKALVLPRDGFMRKDLEEAGGIGHFFDRWDAASIASALDAALHDPRTRAIPNRHAGAAWQAARNLEDFARALTAWPQTETSDNRA